MKKIARKGLMLILSSPSGAGKTTISKKLLEKDPFIYMSVSATTRPIRANEQDGSDYYFLSKDEFSDALGKAEFLESAEVFGNMYGTPKTPVYDMLHDGKDVLFDIDWQGTKQLKEICKKDVVSIFILPPSMEELEKRLRNRATDDEAVITDRMSKAAKEIESWKAYDYILVNKDIEETAERVHNILLAERHKQERLLGLTDFIEDLIDT